VFATRDNESSINWLSAAGELVRMEGRYIGGRRLNNDCTFVSLSPSLSLSSFQTLTLHNVAFQIRSTHLSIFTQDFAMGSPDRSTMSGDAEKKGASLRSTSTLSSIVSYIKALWSSTDRTATPKRRELPRETTEQKATKAQATYWTLR
jgi:hypothetical protein